MSLFAGVPALVGFIPTSQIRENSASVSGLNLRMVGRLGSCAQRLRCKYATHPIRVP